MRNLFLYHVLQIIIKVNGGFLFALHHYDIMQQR